MEIYNLFLKARVLLPATLMFVSLNSFSQVNLDSAEKNRPEINYKQVHSSNLTEQTGLFADGLKLKLDLSVLDDVEEQREEFNPNDIPADD